MLRREAEARFKGKERDVDDMKGRPMGRLDLQSYCETVKSREEQNRMLEAVSSSLWAAWDLKIRLSLKWTWCHMSFLWSICLFSNRGEYQMGRTSRVSSGQRALWYSLFSNGRLLPLRVEGMKRGSVFRSSPDCNFWPISFGPSIRSVDTHLNNGFHQCSLILARGNR